MLFIPIVICSSDDSEKITKPVQYKKVFVFFPIRQEMPDFIKNSIFGKRYFKALSFYNNCKKKFTDFEYVTDIPEYAQKFVKKGINDFEKHYEFGLNKNYAKKMKLLLIAPLFWILFFYWIWSFFYFKKKIFSLISLGLFVYYFFVNLYPCQLKIFWEQKILQNYLQIRSFLQHVLWCFNHPLQKKSNRILLIDMYTSQLKAMYCTLAQLDQDYLTETVCPFPIFLKSFSCMSQLCFHAPILIFFQKTALESIKQKINYIKLLFHTSQSFKIICYEYNDLKNKDVYYWLHLINKDCFIQHMIDPLKDLENEPFYAIFHIRSSSISRCKEYDRVAYEIASNAQTHLIHFELFDKNIVI